MLFYNKNIFERCFNHKGKYWYKNIKEIPLYFKLMHYLIKHGYDEYATWEIFNWFTEVMKSILINYNANRFGTPIILENYFELLKSDANVDEENERAWDHIIKRMIELLELMDERNSKYNSKEYDGTDGYNRMHDEMCAAKDEFFVLFSKYFYHLWD